MNKLIKLLNKFILVNDKKIKIGDKILSPTYEIQTCIGFKTGIGSDLISWIKVKETTTLQQILNSEKIIAGIPETKSINLNGFEEELSNISTINVKVILKNNIYLITKIIK